MKNEDRELDELTKRLLNDSRQAPPFPREEVRGRIARAVEMRRISGRRPQWVRGAGMAFGSLAASLLIFVGGVEYGRRLAAVPEAPDAALGMPVSVPLSIQSAGTQYVSAVAQFAERRQELPAEERDQARQVALAVLYGVAVELLRSDVGDTELAALLRSAVGRERSPDAQVLWF